MSSSTRVAIVGGGLSGLAAACHLALGGHTVTVLEKSAHTGGRAATVVRDGFAFNLGPHALYTGGAMSTGLAELGVSYGPQHGPTSLVALHSGRFSPMPISVMSLLRSKQLGIRDKVELGRLFAGLQRIRPSTLRTISVQNWIDEVAQRPAVRELLAANARTATYTSALDLVSADVFVEKVQRSMTSPIHYVDGGWQSIVDGLERRARQLGARVERGVRVAEVLHSDARVTGLALADGSSLEADAVVLAVDPHSAAELAPVVAPSVRELVPVRVAALDVALSRLPDPRHLVVQDLEHPRFMSAQSQFALLAPEGSATVTSFMQLDPRDAGDPGAHAAALEDLLDTCQPGWRDVLVHRVFLPDITAVGTLPCATTDGLAGRPSEDSAGVAGLLLAGDWVGSEGFLADACFASARRAAGLVSRTRSRHGDRQR